MFFGGEKLGGLGRAAVVVAAAGGYMMSLYYPTPQDVGDTRPTAS